jgi:regulatory protein
MKMVRKITAITLQKRNPNRVNIYLDGEFAFGISRNIAVRLDVGHELDDETISSLHAKDEEEVAYLRALKFISYRIRTEDEIKRNLSKHRISSEVISNVLLRLGRNGLVDDIQFANSWVENRNEFRPRAHRMLTYELRKKGISDEVISQSLDNTISDQELAFKAAQNQVHKYKELEWPIFRRKLHGFLSRRGFSYTIISLVVDQVWAEIKSQEKTVEQ